MLVPESCAYRLSPLHGHQRGTGHQARPWGRGLGKGPVPSGLGLEGSELDVRAEDALRLHPIPGWGQGNSLENSLRAVVISSSVTAGSPAPGAVLGTRDNLPGKHREQLRVFAQVFMPNPSPLDVYRTPAARQRLYGLPWRGERKGDARVGSEGGGAALFGGTLPRDSGEPPSGRTGVLVAPCLHCERPASLSFVSKPSKPETGAATRR